MSLLHVLLLLLSGIWMLSVSLAAPSESEIAIIPDVDRTFEEWKLLSKKILTLKCNAYNLNTRGSRDDLAVRLYELHHPNPIFSTPYIPVFQEQHTNINLTAPLTTLGVQDSAFVGSNGNAVSETQQAITTNTGTSGSTTLSSSGRNSKSPTVSSSPLLSTKLHRKRPSQGGNIDTIPIQKARTSLSTGSLPPHTSTLNVSIAQAIQTQLPAIVTEVVRNVNERINSTQSASSGLRFGLPNVGNNGRLRNRGRRQQQQQQPQQLDQFVLESSSDEERALYGNNMHNLALPPIPATVISRIRSGKFVSFDLLLPHSSFVDKDEAVELIATPHNKGLYFSQKTKNKAKVVDFSSWSIAWSVFAVYYAVFFMDSAIQLLGYHNRASELAAQYTWPNFCTYDIQFRQKMANDRRIRTLRWDRIDEDLRARHLRTTQVLCTFCQNFGHHSVRCPERRSSSIHHSDQAKSGATRSRSRVNVCFKFNDLGSCNKPHCRYDHVCGRCGKGHPVSHCPTPSSQP